MEKPDRKPSDKDWLLISYAFGCQWLLVLAAFFSIDGQNVLMHYAIICFEPFLFGYLTYHALTSDKAALSKVIARLNVFCIVLFVLLFLLDIYNFKPMPSLKARLLKEASPVNSPH